MVITLIVKMADVLKGFHKYPTSFLVFSDSSYYDSRSMSR